MHLIHESVGVLAPGVSQIAASKGGFALGCDQTISFGFYERAGAQTHLDSSLPLHRRMPQINRSVMASEADLLATTGGRGLLSLHGIAAIWYSAPEGPRRERAKGRLLEMAVRCGKTAGS